MLALLAAANFFISTWCELVKVEVASFSFFSCSSLASFILCSFSTRMLCASSSAARSFSFVASISSCSLFSKSFLAASTSSMSFSACSCASFASSWSMLFSLVVARLFIAFRKRFSALIRAFSCLYLISLAKASAACFFKKNSCSAFWASRAFTVLALLAAANSAISLLWTSVKCRLIFSFSILASITTSSASLIRVACTTLIFSFWRSRSLSRSFSWWYWDSLLVRNGMKVLAPTSAAVSVILVSRWLPPPLSMTIWSIFTRSPAVRLLPPSNKTIFIFFTFSSSSTLSFSSCTLLSVAILSSSSLFCSEYLSFSASLLSSFSSSFALLVSSSSFALSL